MTVASNHIDIENVSVDIVLCNDLIEVFDTEFRIENTGPTRHYHKKMDQVLYVKEGAVEAVIGNEKIIAKTGDVIHFPKLTPHEFRSIDGPAKLLITCVPGTYHSEYLRQLAEMVKNGFSWGDGITELSGKYDTFVD